MNKLILSTLAVLNVSEGVIHLVTASVSFWGMFSLGVCDWRVAASPTADLVLGMVSLLTGFALRHWSRSPLAPLAEPARQAATPSRIPDELAPQALPLREQAGYVANLARLRCRRPMLVWCLLAAAVVTALGSMMPHARPHQPTVAGVWATSPADASTPLAGNPPEWRTTADRTLRVQKKRLAFPGAAERGGPREVEMLTYNGQLVGPTIRVHRGETLKIKLVNELSADNEPRYPIDLDQEDPPHDLYTTNLHTHGLHVSPTGDSDNPFREVPPGGRQQYTIAIPADHPAGTFWYHPHKHGAVAYQMGNGLAGALIVEGGGPAGKIHDLDDIPEIAHARERILVLQQLVLETDEQGIGRVDPRDSYNEPAPEAYRVTAVNGVVMPAYSMQPDEVQRWRFIGAGREGSFVFCWYDHRHMPVKQMPFYEIAVDGLATGQLTARRGVTMLPGKRSEVLVKAPPQPGTYYLVALQEDETPGAAGRLIVNDLARLVVEGPPRPMALPTSAQLAACKAFDSIGPAACQTKREFVLGFDDRRKRFHINGQSFSQQKTPDRTTLGSVEEWTLSAQDAPEGSPNEPHPFHIHTNPFELVEIENLRSGVVYPVNEWRDTLSVEPGKKAKIRLRFRDFAGPIVLHCHTLDHGDQGMMRTIQVADPSQPDSGVEEPIAKLTECRLPAPTLHLPTPQGPIWNVKTVAGRNVILVFFRGMQCVHCVRQLRNLLERGRDLTGGGDVAIVAVGALAMDDPAQALKWLRVPTGLDFCLLTDERHEAFRAFGCYDDGPRHGLFVIDKSGTIVARYSGPAPLDDVEAVWERVQRLRSLDGSKSLTSLDDHLNRETEQ